MARTVCYALDQEYLTEDKWELADTSARLHSIATEDSSGVVRVTVADLMLALDVCDLVEEREEARAHGYAIARIRAALGAECERAY